MTLYGNQINSIMHPLYKARLQIRSFAYIFAVFMQYWPIIERPTYLDKRCHSKYVTLHNN